MRSAAVPGYRLSKAKPSVKVLTTLGLLGLLLGLLSASALTLAKTGLAPSSVRAYYLGTDSANELDQLLAPNTARPFAELAEVTHLHLSGGSLLLFLLCHLLSVCELSERTRIFWYSVSFGSFLLTFACPWLIIYASPQFAYLFGPAIGVFTLSLIGLTYLPLREIWFQSNAAS
ncbi:MAG: hypothetical protein K1X83_00695 [Oligoflexia bacterium]|nr:hypothetical protein [Oligoflexia bacterium]